MFAADTDLEPEKVFELREGLQRGAVKSPLLFNLYTYDLLRLFDLNSATPRKGITFADDLLFIP